MKERDLLMTGKASVSFPEPVYIQSCASIVGKKEGEGPLGNLFDQVVSDPLFGTDTWEAGESAMQKSTALLALEKGGLTPQDLRLCFAGDLLAQTSATSFGTADLEVPFYGLFGACSTMGEALSLGAFTVAGGFGDPVLCVASSHFASAEKEFRFPLGYGNQRPLSATWTVTGCGACILEGKPPSPENEELCTEKGCAAITGLTTGQLVDFGLKDSLNMGACMAPAACHTILRNLQDFGRSPRDYDAILTGDLGLVGQRILFDLTREKGLDIQEIHKDCGLLIFQNDSQDTHSGGSGCGCSAAVLSAYILPKLASGAWKRVLFLPTGALLSKTSFNEGDTIPGIAHGVVLEHIPLPET
ncbi:MAG: stage V sporulation protein AD [Eubacteriales bacterium]|nr:stage V sporulation protein AD [Eubacteriales bacterium]